MRIGKRVAVVVGGLLLALLAVAAFLAISDPGGEGFFHKRVYDVVLGGAAALVLLRAFVSKEQRAPWTALGIAMLFWTAGNVYYTSVLWDLEVIPVPSVSDAFWLTFYVVAIFCIRALTRDGTRSKDPRAGLDGLMAAFTIAAVVCATLLDPILGHLEGNALYVGTGLAFPLLDLIMVGILVSAAALRGWRMTLQAKIIGFGAVLFATIDLIYMFQTTNGTWNSGNILEGAWPLAMLVFVLAAWAPLEKQARQVDDENWWSIAVPCALALVALVILVIDHFWRVNTPTLILVTASVVIVLARMFFAFSGHVRLIRTHRRSALTDPLTGLGNRRALERDVEAILLDPPDGRSLLAVFDLDGFKGYNDAFGHPAGDALLIRLAHRLSRATSGRGSAYRLGGDEFCVLATVTADEIETLIAASRTALSESGPGFSVSSSSGHAELGSEHAGYTECMRTADRLLYADKNSGRLSAGTQTASVLMQVLNECDPELSLHLDDVKNLASKTAEHLGIEGKALEDVCHAAALHDVGKVAIPEAILNKPGPLTDEEWAFMRRHTIIGQRILDAAPAMNDVGQIVRSSHERFDGGGYPDKLSGESIPLGARIIAVSDAWDAMTSERPYKSAFSQSDAREEIIRCAGSQFDPMVVEAFLAVIDAEAAPDRHPLRLVTDERTSDTACSISA